MQHIKVQITLTSSIICGFLVIITGIISLFIVRDTQFASTCIVTGAGIVGAAKVCNTFEHNHNKQPTKPVRTITLAEYHNLSTEELTRSDIEWKIVG